MLKQLIVLARLAITGVTALMSVGCASFLNSPITSVTIDSNPQNASFVIKDHNGEVIHSGTTPEDVLLHNSKAMYQRAQYSVRYELADLPPQTTELNATLSPYYFGNLFFLYPGVFGFLVIDPFTGAIYDLPQAHSVDLNALSNNSLSNDTLRNDASSLNPASDLITVTHGRGQ